MILQSEPIFPSHARAGTNSSRTIARGRALTPQGIATIVKRIAARAGVTSTQLAALRPHDLRRTFAQLAKDGGADIEMIQHSLGHSSIATTEVYLNSIQNMKIGHTAPDHIKVRNGRKTKP